MKLKMAENSLFAILLRSAWWISLAIALGFIVIARALLPTDYFVFGAAGAAPFLVIAAIAGWKQLKAPSAARILATRDALGAMNWTEFTTVLEAALQRDDYQLTRLSARGAEIQAIRSGRTTLIACKRWKVARTGIETLRELEAARIASEAHDSIYVTTGELTENARSFAAEKKIRLWQSPELASLLGRIRPRARS